MNAVFVSFGQIEQLATAGRYLSIDGSIVADRSIDRVLFKQRVRLYLS